MTSGTLWGKGFFFHFNKKDITSKISLGSWGVAKEKTYVSGHLSSPITSWDGDSHSPPLLGCPFPSGDSGRVQGG